MATAEPMTPSEHQDMSSFSQAHKYHEDDEYPSEPLPHERDDFHRGPQDFRSHAEEPVDVPEDMHQSEGHYRRGNDSQHYENYENGHALPERLECEVQPPQDLSPAPSVGDLPASPGASEAEDAQDVRMRPPKSRPESHRKSWRQSMRRSFRSLQSLKFSRSTAHLAPGPDTVPGFKRYLSKPEQVMKRACDLGIFTIGVMSIFNSPDHEITPDAFDHALTLLYDSYETLQLSPRSDPMSKRHYWVNTGDMEAACSFSDLGDLTRGEVREKFEHEVNVGVRFTEQQWRACYCRLTDQPQPNTYAVFLVVSHALVDGIGVKLVFRDLFIILGEISKGQTPKDPPKVPIAVSPPYEDLMKMPVILKIVQPISFSIKNIYRLSINTRQKIPKFISHSLFTSAPNLRPLMWDDPSLPKKASTEVLVLSRDQWAALQRFRKHNDLTVSGVLIALFGVAFMNFAFNPGPWKTTSLVIHCLRDPRRYFKAEDLDPRARVANYIASGMFIRLKFPKHKHKKGKNAALDEDSNEDIIHLISKMAESATTQIRRNVANMQTFLNAEAFIDIGSSTKLMRDFVEIFQNDRASCGRYCMVEFSNLGSVDEDPYPHKDDQDAVRRVQADEPMFGRLQSQECLALSDQSIIGDCFINIPMTIQGEMSWAISYPTHMYDQARMKQLMDELKRLITTLLAKHERRMTNASIDPIPFPGENQGASSRKSQGPTKYNYSSETYQTTSKVETTI